MRALGFSRYNERRWRAHSFPHRNRIYAFYTFRTENTIEVSDMTNKRIWKRLIISALKFCAHAVSASLVGTVYSIRTRAV